MTDGTIRRIGLTLEMIKWQHTIFALPFALGAAALATTAIPPQTATWWLVRLGLIIIACAAARTAAMTYNRLVDRDVDATNPRTAMRPSVTGQVSVGFMIVFTALCCLVFIVVAWFLNRLAFELSFLVLLVLLGYSHAKRFTLATHLWLGVSLGLAPMGAWVAVTGAVAWAPVALGVAVVLWVAGFDILYALADIEHDRQEKLFSIPAALGMGASMDLAKALHTLVIAVLALLGLMASLGVWYFAAIIAGCIILFAEHRLVKPDDLSRLPTAFLTLNGLFSLIIALGLMLEVWTA